MNKLDNNLANINHAHRNNQGQYEENENGMNYDNHAFNNPAEIYKKPSKNIRLGNNYAYEDAENAQNDIRGYGNNSNQNFEEENYNINNINYSNISNRDYQNMNYSNEEIQNEYMMQQNFHQRSPDSLLRYNNSNSQSPDNNDPVNYHNTYENRNNNLFYKERERSPQENINDPYFKK